MGMQVFLEFSMKCHDKGRTGMSCDDSVAQATQELKAGYKAQLLGKRVPENQAEKQANEFANRIAAAYVATISGGKCKKIAAGDVSPRVKAAALAAEAAYSDLARGYLNDENIVSKKEAAFLAAAALTCELCP